MYRWSSETAEYVTFMKKCFIMLKIQEFPEKKTAAEPVIEHTNLAYI
jgi:hypothetical protein